MIYDHFLSTLWVFCRKKFYYEQVEAGQLADMWGFAMPIRIQNLLENIIQHLPRSNYVISKNEIVTHFEIVSSMLTNT